MTKPGEGPPAMRFALLLLVNAAVFIRPGEVIPALVGMPVYEGLFLACLAASYPAVVAQFTPERLLGRPVTACALGMLVAIVLSHLANFEAGEAWATGTEFAKVFLYYILLVAVIDTPKRLERFLTWTAVFAAAITVMAVLHYYKVVHIQAIELVRDTSDGSGEESSMFQRLGSTGVFADPNDMCLMLVMAMTVCLYQIVERRRFYWAAPLALFGHALMLTHSRGGFLGMLTALVVLMFARFGRKALLLGVPVLPAVFLLFAGRQTNISLKSGTGQTRVELWAEGMAQFVRRPLFGIGSEHYVDFAGHVAHNSFIHSYTELGLFGGTIFLSAFYLAFWPIVRLRGPKVPPLSPDLRRLGPYVMAIVAGYAGGLMSLSCPYYLPTYMVLALGAIYVRLAEDELGVPVARLNGRLVRRLVGLSLACASVMVVVLRLARAA